VQKLQKLKSQVTGTVKKLLKLWQWPWHCNALVVTLTTLALQCMSCYS